SSARPTSVGEALESLIAAGNAAGILSGVAYLPPPSDPEAFRLGTAPTTGPGAFSGTIPVHQIVTGPTIPSSGLAPSTDSGGGGGASPNGSTFLESAADVAPVRSSRARLGLFVGVALAAFSIGAA